MMGQLSQQASVLLVCVLEGWSFISVSSHHHREQMALCALRRGGGETGWPVRFYSAIAHRSYENSSYRVVCLMFIGRPGQSNFCAS